MGRMPESAHLDAINEKWGAPSGRMMTIDSAASEFVQLAAMRGWGALKAKKDILLGIQKTQAMMHNDRLAIDERCINLLRETTAYIWSTNVTVKESPVHKNCDGLDALRYAVASRMLY